MKASYENFALFDSKFQNTEKMKQNVDLMQGSKFVSSVMRNYKVSSTSKFSKTGAVTSHIVKQKVPEKNFIRSKNR